MLDAASKYFSHNEFTTSREKYGMRLLYLKSIEDGHCSKLREEKKILISLPAPDCKYTGSSQSRRLPHTTALFCEPMNLTYTNHILGGRERIQLRDS